MEILAFGIVKDIFGNSVINIDVKTNVTVEEIKNLLEERFPGLATLGSYMIAVNNEYASNDDTVYDRDEIAVIPPVSGG